MALFLQKPQKNCHVTTQFNLALCINMVMEYLQIQPESRLPYIGKLNPFRAVIIIDESVSSEWQKQVSTWIVRSGCLYMMAWGNECSSWDDSVDLANLEEFNYKDIPETKFVMTTWHENETLKEVFWFSKNTAFHPEVELPNTLILHIAKSSREQELLAEYNNA